MTMTDMLIIGGSGFVGGRTAQAARAAHLSVACTHLNRPPPPGIPAFRLEIGDLAALIACLEQTRPHAIIYCPVTYSNSESEQMCINAEGVSQTITSLLHLGLNSRLVYVSTNSVFSGSHGPYREDDRPDPENLHNAYRSYGLGRRAGEEITLAGWPESIVTRTANVEGRDTWGKLYRRLAGSIETLRNGLPLLRFVDRTISPTLVDSLAKALVEVAQPSFTHRGVLHLAGSEPVTDYEYTLRLARKLRVDETLVREDHCLPPGATGSYNMALDVTFSQSLLSTRLLGVDELLETCLL